MAMQQIGITKQYSYELQVPTTNVFYDGSSSTIVRFRDSAILIEKENGVEINRYVGDFNIKRFLIENQAFIFGKTNWYVGNIDINDNKDIFVKDETTAIAYSFWKDEIVNGDSVRTLHSITQYVNVNYFTCNVSQSISSSQNPLHLFDFERELVDEDFEFDIKYHSNNNGNHSIKEIKNPIITYTKKVFNKNDTELTSSPYRNSITINAWNELDHYTNTYYFNIYFEKEATITSVKFVGTDTTKYFTDRENVFKLPTYQVEFSFSDGTVYVQDVSSLNMTFRRYNLSGLYTPLIPNETIIYEDFEVVCLIENVKYEELTYGIKFENVKIESVSVSNFNTLYLGSTLQDYEGLYKATITYNDGTTVSGVDFTFEDNELRKTEIVSGLALPSKLTIVVLGEKLEINTPTTFSNPNYNGLLINDRTVIKDVSKIVVNDAVLIYEIPFTSVLKKRISRKVEVVLTSDSFSTKEINGEQVVDNVIGSYQVTATAKDYFNNSDRTQTFNINVKDISSLTSWELKEIKQEYKIGEKYLVDDDTKVAINFSGEVVLETLSSLVESGLFITFPQANYEFKTVMNNREIVVKSNFGDGKDQISYSIDIVQDDVSTSNSKITIKAVFIDWEIALENVHLKKKKDFWLLVDDSVVETNGQLKAEYKNQEIADENSVDIYGYIKGYKWYVYGYLENVNNKSRNGKVVLFKDHYNSVYGHNNMIVKFPCYVEGNADKINKSTFGIMFGADNYNNRLFVSGNSDYQNRDWHTADITGAFNEEYDNESENNLTYFPDVNEQQYGSSDTKVVGYDIVSDSKMLVLKEKSNHETTVYFRTPTYNEDDNGLINEVFTVAKGNNSVAGINPHSIINFNGDTLFIDSDNTLQGLDLVGIQGDTQRYANSRSKLIDNKLKDYDLSNSILWTNQKYLYLTVNGLGTFITHYETKGDSQYEWWLVDYDSPQAFIEIDGITYYGNNKGEFFKINKNSFVDIHKVFIGGGEGIYITHIYPDDSVEEIVLSERIVEKVKEGDKFKHYISNDYTKNIYKRVCSIGSESGLDLKIENGVIEMKLMPFIDTDGKTAYRYPVNEKDAYFLNMHCNTQGTVAIKWEGHETDFGVPFKFKYVKGSTTKVELYQNNVKQDVSKLICADVCLRVEKDTPISVIDNKEGTIKLEDNTNIVAYGDQDQQVDLIRGEISHIDNVKAYYITSPLLANIQYTKTLWDFTLTNDSGLPSELQLGVARNKMPKKPSQFVSYSATDFDYDEVDYNTLTFESIEIPRVFTRHKVMPKLKFVCFALMNENNTNCVLTSMAITYTIPFPQV